MADLKTVMNAAKSAGKAMQEARGEETAEDKILHELKALNSKMTWFVFLSIVSILASLLF